MEKEFSRFLKWLGEGGLIVLRRDYSIFLNDEQTFSVIVFGENKCYFKVYEVTKRGLQEYLPSVDDKVEALFNLVKVSGSVLHIEKRVLEAVTEFSDFVTIEIKNGEFSFRSENFGYFGKTWADDARVSVATKLLKIVLKFFKDRIIDIEMTQPNKPLILRGKKVIGLIAPCIF